MDRLTPYYLSQARAGEPVHVCDVRTGYAELPAGESFAVILTPEGVDDTVGRTHYPLRLPRFSDYPEAEKKFVIDFFLACVNNLVAGLGGSSLHIANPDGADEVNTLLKILDREFEVFLPRHRRAGYGRGINVAERLQAALAPDSPQKRGFRFLSAGSLGVRRHRRPASGSAEEVFRTSPCRRLRERCILGMDVGGTDVKLALSVGGRLTGLYEFDWNPAAYAGAEQIIAPLAALTRLMALAAAMTDDAAFPDRIREIIHGDFTAGADAATLAAVLDRLEAETGARPVLFDAIGLCFPDVVANNKIVGGETPKTMTMRSALGEGYDRDFAALTDLDIHLRPYVKETGKVSILNDGAMAAFTSGVELAIAKPSAISAGIFSHTLGTDLGSGLIDANGRIPDIPLEVYSFIVDLGSFPDRLFPADDVRGINNFNTGLPGTMQKIACQSGVFRLAFRYLTESRPDLLQDVFDRGYLVQNDAAVRVPVTPVDMRKPFLEYIMELAGPDGPEEINRIFSDIGAALAAAADECDWVFAGTAGERILYGRLVKREECFRLLRQASESGTHPVRLVAADANLAESDLMRELAASPIFTIAQFAQAVGAIHYGNSRIESGGNGKPYAQAELKPFRFRKPFHGFGWVLLFAVIMAGLYAAVFLPVRISATRHARLWESNQAFRSPLLLHGNRVYFVQSDWTLTVLDANTGEVVHRGARRHGRFPEGRPRSVRRWLPYRNVFLLHDPVFQTFSILDCVHNTFEAYNAPDGILYSDKWLVAEKDGAMYSVDSETGKETRVVEGPELGTNRKRYDIVGNHLFVLLPSDEGTLRCHNLETGEMLWQARPLSNERWDNMACTDQAINVFGSPRNGERFPAVSVFGLDGRWRSTFESEELAGVTDSKPFIFEGVQYKKGRRVRAPLADAAPDNRPFSEDRNDEVTLPGGGKVTLEIAGDISSPSGQYTFSLAFGNGKERWTSILNGFPPAPAGNFETLYLLSRIKERFTLFENDSTVLYAADHGKVEALDKKTGRSKWLYSFNDFPYDTWREELVFPFAMRYWRKGVSTYATDRPRYEENLSINRQLGATVIGDKTPPSTRFIIDPAPPFFPQRGVFLVAALTWGTACGVLLFLLLVAFVYARGKGDSETMLRTESRAHVGSAACALVTFLVLVFFARYSNISSCLLLFDLFVSLCFFVYFHREYRLQKRMEV